MGQVLEAIGKTNAQGEHHDDDFDSEDLDECQIEELQHFSAAAEMKNQGIATNLQRGHSIRPKIDDENLTETFNQELAYIKEFIHEAGYNASQETLQDATAEQIEEWERAKAELVKKDAMIDHASQKISLSYKGFVVDHKLGQLRKKMIEADHSLIIGDFKDSTIENRAIYL